jgi:hypothetical protein
VGRLCEYWFLLVIRIGFKRFIKNNTQKQWKAFVTYDKYIKKSVVHHFLFRGNLQAKISQQWGTSENMMYVVGATRAEQFAHVRSLAPDHFFLVPGVGAQGGDLGAISRSGMNSECGLLVNSSRQIIFAGAGEDFAEKARAETMKVQQEMEKLLAEKDLIRFR